MTSQLSEVQTRVITVFGNGVIDDIGHKVVLNKRTAPNYDKVLDLVGKLIPLDGGVRKLYTLPDCKLVRGLEQLRELQHNEFVAVGLKALNRDKLPRHIENGHPLHKHHKHRRQYYHGHPRKHGTYKLAPMKYNGHARQFPRGEPLGKIGSRGEGRREKAPYDARSVGRHRSSDQNSDATNHQHHHQHHRHQDSRGEDRQMDNGSGPADMRNEMHVNDHVARVLDKSDDVIKIKDSERDRQRRAHLEKLMLRQRLRQANHAARMQSMSKQVGAVDNRILSERDRQAAALREKIGRRVSMQHTSTNSTGGAGTHSMSEDEAAAKIQATWKAHKVRSEHSIHRDAGKSSDQKRSRRKHKKRDHEKKRKKDKSKPNTTDSNSSPQKVVDGGDNVKLASPQSEYEDLLKADRIPTPDLSISPQDMHLLRNSAATTIQRHYRVYAVRRGPLPPAEDGTSSVASIGSSSTSPSKKAKSDKKGKKRKKKQSGSKPAKGSPKSRIVSEEIKSKPINSTESQSNPSPFSGGDERKPQMVREESRFSMRGIEDKRVVEDRYDIGKAIGDGNFAVVKECVDRRTGDKLALKIIDKSKTKGAKETKMIENEVKTMRSIQHPHCVRLYDVIDTDKELYLVMELVQGGDLFDRIVVKGKYAEKDAVRLIKCMAEALNFMHTRGFIHRDLKPENLLVVTDPAEGTDTVKLADFGLSMKVQDKLFTICGTPTYVAPEIISEPCGGYGLPVDMWATGVIAYIILCGFPPFASPTKDQRDLFRRIRSGKFSFPKPYWSNVSEDAKDLIRKLLIVDPKERYTAAQVLEHRWIANADVSPVDLSDEIDSKL